MLRPVALHGTLDSTSRQRHKKGGGTNGTVLDGVKPFIRMSYRFFAGVVEARFWAVSSTHIGRVDA